MATKKTVRIQDVVGLVNALYPPVLAEEWDNVGLQVGDPEAAVTHVAVSLDPSPVAVDAALRLGAQVLICHHPLIFRPLKQVTSRDETGRLITKVLREGLAVVAAHTNLDRAGNGLNDWLALQLGLEATAPLELPGGLLFKLVVFVPLEHADAVAEALFAAGAGRVGAYDRVSFRSPGTGGFRPSAAAQPFIGQSGQDETVEEFRLEVLVPKESLGRVLARLVKAHPYEEVAYDVVPLENSRHDIGLGRIGRWPQPLPLADAVQKVKAALGADTVRIAGHCKGDVKKIAVCGGSGASLLHAAARQGADLLVTGDVGYHDARKAEELGIGLVDAGHFATEHIVVEHLGQALKKAAVARGFDLEISAVSGEQDPFRTV